MRARAPAIVTACQGPAHRRVPAASRWRCSPSRARRRSRALAPPPTSRRAPRRSRTRRRWRRGRHQVEPGAWPMSWAARRHGGPGPFAPPPSGRVQLSW